MNNEEKNTYVKKQITEALLKLLEQHEFEEISISQITACAQVSRNSFYRNYENKEDILLHYVRRLFTDWRIQCEKRAPNSTAELYGDLFQHLSDNKDFYLLLKRRKRFHQYLTVLLQQTGPK
ncbi:MAG: TetR/AcrR family transcriptional regulator, partial [Lachnospiraceae bacterium]|nr:TetR/AcrR family transcriptional regulator [Lachnospiraceae bacterium]